MEMIGHYNEGIQPGGRHTHDPGDGPNGAGGSGWGRERGVRDWTHIKVHNGAEANRIICVRDGTGQRDGNPMHDDEGRDNQGHGRTQCAVTP